MKIALLLTGQLRTVDMVKYLHMNSIIKKYDVDVFLSMDLNNSKQCLYENNIEYTNLEKIKKIISFFKPIDYYICNDYSKEFQKIQKKNIEIGTISNINNHFMLLFEQYYIVKQAYKLLKEHIKKTNTKYDLIIRVRFDQFIWTDESHDIIQLINKTVDNKIIYNSDNIELLNKISENQTINFTPFHMFDAKSETNSQLITASEGDFLNEKICNKPNDKVIYLLGFGDFCHYKYANDQFWFHNSNLIDVISRFYDNIYKLLFSAIKNDTGNCGAMIEHLWYTYLVNNNINIQKSNVCGVFVREYL